ncbi:MAG: immunity 70 family protein [Peptostreptococcaceae bacterium]|nr:immunity 70 family protein [Peptostreptococcaceae bacterium]
MISFRVGSIMYEIGTPSFLHSFFSTVAYRLENEKWGSKFPVIMNELYQGKLSYRKASVAKEELDRIKKGLALFLPDKVIWDIDDLSKRPPWGNDISESITSLENYFVTCDGRDFIEILDNALDDAIEMKEDVLIQ